MAPLQVADHKTCTCIIRLDGLYIPSFNKIIVTCIHKMQPAGFSIVITVILMTLY
jgi:hypothetical protein